MKSQIFDQDTGQAGPDTQECQMNGRQQQPKFSWISS